jgi:hypothetical protein
MDLIQRKFKLRLHLNQMVSFSNKLLRPESFTEMTQCVRDKKIVRVFKTRELLTAFVVHKYPNEMLDNSVFDYYLQKYARDVVELYERIVSTKKRVNYVYFWHTTDKYIDYFNKWKAQDIHKILVPLAQEHQSLDKQKERYIDEAAAGDAYAQEIIEHMTLLQQKIRSQIASMAVTSVDELLAGAQELTIEETIIQDFNKSFWRQFYNSIKAQDYTQVPLFLQDFIQMVKGLVPNRTDIHAEMESIIDHELIHQQLINSALNTSDILTIMNYVIGIVEQLQAAADDQDTKMFRDLLADMFMKQFRYEEILTFFFSTVFKKLEKIKHALATLIQETPQ